MIKQLIRTKFESHLTASVFFVIFNLALLGMITLLNEDRNDRIRRTGIPNQTAQIQESLTGGPAVQNYMTFQAEVFSIITGWLVGICLVMAGIALLRHSKEKRTRLYMQLPASSREIRLAHWGLAGIYMCVPTLVTAYFIIYIGEASFSNFLLFTILFYFHLGCLIAIATLVMNYWENIIPVQYRHRGLIRFILMAILITAGLPIVALAVSGYVYVAHDGPIYWGLFTLLMALLFFVLVSLDLYLFNRRDNYLE